MVSYNIWYEFIKLKLFFLDLKAEGIYSRDFYCFFTSPLLWVPIYVVSLLFRRKVEIVGVLSTLSIFKMTWQYDKEGSIPTISFSLDRIMSHTCRDATNSIRFHVTKFDHWRQHQPITTNLTSKQILFYLLHPVRGSKLSILLRFGLPIHK